jgi:hypothetical protein
VQGRRDHPLAKPANRRFVRHRLAGAQPDELLKAQTVAELRLGLRVAQPVEVLEQHHAPEHRRPVARPAQLAVSRLQPPLGLGKIHQRRDLFQHLIGPRPLRQRPILKSDLLVLRLLHPLSTPSPNLAFNHFAEVSVRVGFALSKPRVGARRLAPTLG